MSRPVTPGLAGQPSPLRLEEPCRVPWCVARARDERDAWPGARDRVIRHFARTQTGQWCSRHVAAARRGMRSLEPYDARADHVEEHKRPGEEK